MATALPGMLGIKDGVKFRIDPSADKLMLWWDLITNTIAKKIHTTPAVMTNTTPAMMSRIVYTITDNDNDYGIHMLYTNYWIYYCIII